MGSVLGLASCASATSSDDPTTGARDEPASTSNLSGNRAPTDSALARATTEELKSRFRLAESSAIGFESDGARLSPLQRAGSPSARERPAVRLGVRATSAVRLESAAGITLDAALGLARDVAAETAGGYVIYHDVLEGADQITLPISNGVEDGIVFWRAPSGSELQGIDYAVTLGERVAGLRLVDESLELLDESAAPRLRMARPYLTDAVGEHRFLHVLLRGCAADLDPRGPWRRPVTPPGSRNCIVRLEFDAQKLAYPILIDPAWTATNSMSTPRWSHTATLLGNGQVLVVGGYGSMVLSSAELYDAPSGTWATTAALQRERREHTATLLTSGEVLVAGGRTQNATALFDTWRYSPTTGSWTSAGSMQERRSWHSATRMSDGRVLVAAGWNNGDSSTAEIYDPGSNGWSYAPTSLKDARDSHAATLLPSGEVLVTGGYPSAIGQTAEIFDPVSGVFTPTTSMSIPRCFHTITTLSDGRALVVGGGGDCHQWSSANETPTAELYTRSSRTWASAGALSNPLSDQTATLLANGNVLVAGGGTGALAALAKVALFDPVSGTWSPAGDMTAARSGHTATRLTSGTVLVAGGASYADPSTGIPIALSSAELFAVAPLGAPCSTSGECGSGHCADGVCCDSACSGTCQACTSALKGSGSDGACAAIAAGSDPQSECSDQGALTCGTDGTCDGAGACRFYAVGTPCGPSSCTNDVLATAACSGVGGCVPKLTSCAPFACIAGACTTSCSSDAECVASAYCDTNGTCQPDEVAAQTCTRDAECATGHCSDQVCCDQACDAPCFACTLLKKGTGADGVCAAVTSGADPDGDCPDDGAASCGRDGTCDGAGGCAKYRVGTPCGVTVCVVDVTQGALCDSNQQCQSGLQADCTPYTCANGACRTDCVSDAGCATDAYCELGQCHAHLVQGQVCSRSSECHSGFCVDGVCCNAPCEGQCEACNLSAAPGACVPVVGDPVLGRPACPTGSSNDPCSTAVCNGIDRGFCGGYVGSSVTCHEASCSGVAERTLPARCDGKGSCPRLETQDCGAYACEGDACRTDCDGDADCSPGNRCQERQCVAGAICDGEHTLVDPVAGDHDCSPYRCLPSNTCGTACGSSADCVTGAACSASGVCVLKSAGGAEQADSGCGCRLERNPVRGGAVALYAVLAAALGAARSKRRRHAGRRDQN